MKNEHQSPDHRNYVIISSIDWSLNWQIHQQLATSLVESGHRVLFIENTGMRAFRAGDFGRILDRLRNWLKSTRGFFDVRDQLTVFSPIFVPFPYSSLALTINRYILSNSIAKWMKIGRFHDPILISFLPTPLAQSLINDIDPLLVVYYCADYMSGRSEGAKRGMKYEDAFYAKADAVLCTSHALMERAERFNSRVFLVPAGVEFSKFETARKEAAIPDDLAALPRPIVGYVGAISAVFDQELLVHAARALPAVTFALVGPEFADVSLLKTCSNIKLLGKRPYSDVPAYIKGFDVALIPYVKNVLTDAVYSCKLNEYLAMGVQVIATDMREIRLYIERHGDVVDIAKNQSEFVQKISAEIAAPATDREIARIAAARANSWDQRFEDISQVIEQLLEAKKIEVTRWQDRLTGLYRVGRIRMVKVGLALAVSYALLFYTPILWFASDVLVIRDAPKAADVIMVFSGDGESGYINASYQNRVGDALTLYRAGFAPRIVLSSGKGQTMSETEVVRALLIVGGVPSSAISVVKGTPRSSWENVQMSAEELRRLGVRNVLFVTAPYHSRRATLVWKKSAPDIGISTVSVVDTPPSETRWRTSFQVARVIAYEYLAIADYWWNGRV